MVIKCETEEQNYIERIALHCQGQAFRMINDHTYKIHQSNIYIINALDTQW